MSKIREGLGHSLPFQHGRKKCRSCSCVNSLISFGFLSASLERQLPKLRRKGYCCQCITHFGCCIKRKPRENIQVCVNVLPTSYRHITNCRPTGSLYFGQNLSADSRPFVGRQSAVCRPTDDQQSANRFFGGLFFTITETWDANSALQSLNAFSPTEERRVCIPA